MIQSIKEELAQFYHFLRYPHRFSEYQKFDFSVATKVLLSYYFVFFIGMLFLGPLAYLIDLDSMPHALEEFENMNKFYVFFIGVVLAPTMEELFFRYPMQFKKGILYLLATMAGMVVYFIANKFVTQNIAVPVGILGCLIPVVLIIILKPSSGFINNINASYFPHMFYTVAVYFAFVHFFNFETTGHQWLFTPIMVFPQFLIALFLGYTRLKYGLVSAILLHMVNNLLPMLLIFSAK